MIRGVLEIRNSRSCRNACVGGSAGQCVVRGGKREFEPGPVCVCVRGKFGPAGRVWTACGKLAGLRGTCSARQRRVNGCDGAASKARGIHACTRTHAWVRTHAHARGGREDRRRRRRRFRRQRAGGAAAYRGLLTRTTTCDAEARSARPHSGPASVWTGHLSWRRGRPGRTAWTSAPRPAAAERLARPPADSSSTCSGSRTTRRAAGRLAHHLQRSRTTRPAAGRLEGRSVP